ncbi:hypothetical protein NCC49_006602, partial [Naganishia albida]
MTNLPPSEPPTLDQPIEASDDEQSQVPKEASSAQPSAAGTDTPRKDVQVFGAPLTASYVPPSELPETYFTPTTTDLTIAQSALARRSAALAHRPLQLSAQREEETRQKEQAKRERWPRTVVRVRFSDQTVVQREFESADKIGAVYDFVRGTLAEEYRDKTFTLYQPPNIRFPEHPAKLPPPAKKARPLNQFNAKPPPPIKETLIELQLVPQSLLLVRFDEDELNRSDRKAPLLPHLLASATPLPVAPDFDSASAARPTVDEAPGTGGEPKAEPSKEKKIPKWLQKGLMK